MYVCVVFDFQFQSVFATTSKLAVSNSPSYLPEGDSVALAMAAAIRAAPPLFPFGSPLLVVPAVLTDVEAGGSGVSHL